MKIDGLTDKQRRFCEEYMLDFNGTAAYLRCGYKASPDAARCSATRLLAKASIQRYLQQLRDETAAATGITLERTMQEIGRVAFANISDALSFGPKGVVLRDSSQLPDSVKAAIAAVEFSEVETESGRENRRQSLKMHSKMASLTLLADYFGIRDDFNKARATFKRYGLAILPDSDSPTGWRIEPCSPGEEPQ